MDTNALVVSNHAITPTEKQLKLVDSILNQMSRKIEVGSEDGVTIEEVSKELKTVTKTLVSILDTYRQAAATFRSDSLETFSSKFAPVVDRLILIVGAYRSMVEDAVDTADDLMTIGDTIKVLDNLLQTDLMFIKHQIKGKGEQVSMTESMTKLMKTVPLSGASVISKVPAIDVDPVAEEEQAVSILHGDSVADLMRGAGSNPESAVTTLN